MVNVTLAFLSIVLKSLSAAANLGELLSQRG